MNLTPVQDQAIAARMALVVGGATFDRLFAGVRFGGPTGAGLSSAARARLAGGFSMGCNIGASHEAGNALRWPSRCRFRNHLRLIRATGFRRLGTQPPPNVCRA